MAEARVLVVDDEPGVTLLCQRVLVRAGFEVSAASQPEKGMALLNNQPFDLLLVDIRMPGMDGFELMGAARIHQPNLAVVIMTGFGTVETAIEALRQGADGLILKPFSETNELVRAVRDALRDSHNKREIARLQALRPLFSITESLFSETNPERLIDLILTAICGHLRCDHAGYYHRGPDETFMNLVYGRGSPLPGEESRSDAGPVGQADALGVSIVISGEGPGEESLKEYIASHGLGSILCAPLSLNSEAGGVLLAGRDLGEPAFSEADGEMFSILASQAAVALVNARLYAELRDYVRQVEESQNALIQAEKLAAIGRIMASIAHEINNPLQAVRNCLHLAGREALPLEKRKEYLALSESELKRLMSTMQRMLNFSRPATHDRVRSDLNAILERVLQLLEKQLEAQNIRVHTDLDPPLPEVLVADNQIQQVFFNLVLNAMDAMPEGGDLYIKSGVRDNQVEVLVEDSGPGIPEDQRERIFEPFMSTRDNGTGLGLSVSYNILDAHDGTIELVSGRGQGACFRVAIPLVEAT